VVKSWFSKPLDQFDPARGVRALAFLRLQVHYALSERYRQEERSVRSASTRQPRLVLDIGFAPMPDGAEVGYNLGQWSWKASAIPWTDWNF
jgi:hypothetical protein